LWLLLFQPVDQILFIFGGAKLSAWGHSSCLEGSQHIRFNGDDSIVRREGGNGMSANPMAAQTIFLNDGLNRTLVTRRSGLGCQGTRFGISMGIRVFFSARRKEDYCNRETG
jgi:hypothetical protein